LKIDPKKIKEIEYNYNTNEMRIRMKDGTISLKRKTSFEFFTENVKKLNKELRK